MAEQHAETKIQYAKIDDLLLDPKNPRLGRHNVEKNLSQDDVLDLMKDWTLDELATSFLESGFWPQEALIAVEEQIGAQTRLVVVEGNRRLAALKLLFKARRGEAVPAKWNEIAASGSDDRFRTLEDAPFILKPDRKSVQAYLGFRHVTGIKEWAPAEKAEFIAHLIEDEALTYDQVRRRIGSKTPTVRQSYIAFRLLRQMEDEAEDIDIGKVEERFSVLYLSLRTRGVQQYLHIRIDADERSAKTPVPPERLEQLTRFAMWLFGTEKQEPVITDSRDVDRFGSVLESAKAVEYLERTERPVFEVAFRMAGGDESETAKHVERAADEVEEALRTAHHHKKSKRLQEATRRLSIDAFRLLDLFPAVRAEVFPASEKK
jgi:hypothetical protein